MDPSFEEGENEVRNGESNTEPEKSPSSTRLVETGNTRGRGEEEAAEKFEILDRRFKAAMAPEKELDVTSETVLSQAVAERQQELVRERTAALIQRYQERERDLRKRRMLYRFRALVRLVVMAQSMRHYAADFFERLQGVERSVTEPSALPAFDLRMYKRQKKTLVSQQIKRMMAKPTWLRTDEELNRIYRTLGQLDFFNKYSQATLRAMAAVVNYSYIDPNRVVLRQGHMPLSFYFILSGSLWVYVDEKDHKGKPRTRQVGKLGPGSSFGELALIHNTPRTATVTTRYGSELLSIERDDFDLLLKDAAVHAWRSIYIAISQLGAFSSWTKDEIEHCSNNSKLVKYKNNQMIVGNVEGKTEHLYFVVEGECRLVESLRVVASPTASAGVAFYPLPIDTTSKKPADHLMSWSTTVSRFLHILTWSRGQYFGCGENLLRRYVVAWGTVECLQIPYSYLMRYNHSNWMHLLEDRIQALVPTHKFVFDNFVVRAMWRAYKKDVINQLTKHSKRPTPTSLADVPMSIRRDEHIQNWNAIITHDTK